MMQTLHLLGVPMIGDPENDKGRNTLMSDDVTGELTKKIIDANPKGYWELAIKDIYDMIDDGFGNHEGRAIKIMGAAFTEIPTENIEKVIFCKRRDRMTQAEGLHRIAQIDLEIKEIHGSSNAYIDWFKGKSVQDVYSIQQLTLNHITHVLKRDGIETLDIIFDDVVTNPQPEIEKVVRFLELDVDISAALENVDTRNETSV